METGLVLAGGLVVVIGLAAASVLEVVRGREARPDPDLAPETQGFVDSVADFADAAGSAEGLRSAARAAYETGWDKATADGKALLTRVKRKVRAHEKRIAGDLDSDEIAVLIGLLKRIGG